VSKSPRTSNPHARKPGKRVTASAAAPDSCTRPPGRSQVIGGIDYGPATAAVHDLVEWAIDLAERNVAGRPQDRRRVHTARRFALARLHGKPWRAMPVEDVLFTVALLARIFEADLGLPMSDVVAIVAQQLALHSEMVPIMPRVSSAARRPQDAPLAPLTPLLPHLGAVAVRSAPAGVCGGCGQPAPHFRIAA
jgi:hypothetical protein